MLRRELHNGRLLGAAPARFDSLAGGAALLTLLLLELVQPLVQRVSQEATHLVQHHRRLVPADSAAQQLLPAWVGKAGEAGGSTAPQGNGACLLRLLCLAPQVAHPCCPWPNNPTHRFRRRCQPLYPTALLQQPTRFGAHPANNLVPAPPTPSPLSLTGIARHMGCGSSAS